MAAGLIIAAPASGSGKTAITLALLGLARRLGRAISSAKVGPDYIDPAFHAAATGRPCFNLDGWAMRPETLRAVLAESARDADVVLIEGVMGLFDGAAIGPGGASGSTADLAASLDLPVVLVMNAKGQGATAGAVLEGLARHRRDVRVAGVIFNRVGGAGHRAILAAAAEAAHVPVFGTLPAMPALALPERHLGLRQASEIADLDRFLADAADAIAPHLDPAPLLGIAAPIAAAPDAMPGLPPLGQHIAVARDVAFAFAYPAQLESWRRAGASLSFFSPLGDEAPAPGADAVFLPGGYPELHAGRLAGNRRYQAGLRAAAGRGALVYGECGGYMALGESLTDADGRAHPMAGLLPVATSFAEPRLHLGYRRAALLDAGPLGARGAAFAGHEFHYASVAREAGGAGLFAATDAQGRDLGCFGRRVGKVMGSFLHLIDRAPTELAPHL
ncbi:MAG TPA: cobyrinate a,c-diamide synthase [Dongiaceae bacterium]|nr:cobyrinate a,c-diamide synthase [Dongiaceae bacterium]